MRTALLFVALAGCVPRGPSAPPVPAPPVLDEAAPEQRRRMFLLRGNVSPEAMVRLFTDSACAGPVFLQMTGEALRQGVQVELIAGTDNVFTADAISAEGGVSVCSAPLSLRYLPAQRPGQPSVRLSPNSPSTVTQFVLKGAIDAFARAQLHEGNCSTPVVSELDAERFFSIGFPVEAPVNGSRTVAVDAVNEDQRSVCVAVTAINDSQAPVFSARLASPTPSSNRWGYVAFTGDRLAQVQVYDGPGCGGNRLQSCANCFGVAVPFTPGTTDFTVIAWDEAGNAHCEPGSKPWAFDATIPEEQPVVLLPGDPPLAEVPVGLELAELFYSADCSGEVRSREDGWSLALTGLYLPQRPYAGSITARGVWQDGGVSPCSNAVTVSLP